MQLTDPTEPQADADLDRWHDDGGRVPPEPHDTDAATSLQTND